MANMYIYSLGLVFGCVVLCMSEDTTPVPSTTTTTTITTTTTLAPSTTTPPVAEDNSTSTPTVFSDFTKVCAALKGSCGECVKHAQCLWCPTKNISCIPYPKSQLIPRKDVCDLSDARWGVCWVNYKILLIVMGTIAGVLLISLSCCIYCCCCRRKGNRARYVREEAALERERDDRRAKHSERILREYKRQERQSRMDDIRKKYGLSGGEGDSRYKRFDNEA